jgi:antitoxin component of MazEF toxin-antitoxin module
MTVKILRWGNSADIRRSQPMLKNVGLTAGDYSEVRLLDSATAARPPDDFPEPTHVKVPETKW